MQSHVFMPSHVFLKTMAWDLHDSRGLAIQNMICSDRNPLTSSIASVKGFWTPGLSVVTHSSKSAQTRGTDMLVGWTGALGDADGWGLAALKAASTTLVTVSSACLFCTNACLLNLGSKSVASASTFICSTPQLSGQFNYKDVNHLTDWLVS